VCTVHRAECGCVYSVQCRVKLCVQCTVQSEIVCTVQSAGWVCVYILQCRLRLCVQCTLQRDVVCTVQSAEWDCLYSTESDICEFSWINKRSYMPRKVSCYIYYNIYIVGDQNGNFNEYGSACPHSLTLSLMKVNEASTGKVSQPPTLLKLSLLWNV